MQKNLFLNNLKLWFVPIYEELNYFKVVGDISILLRAFAPPPQINKIN